MRRFGWRGFLVPELARSTSFHRVALISGGIWAAWHAPLILFAHYNAGAPAWYSVACFSAMVVSVGVVSAWLRLRSGSLWPTVLLHASHNAFVQNFFDPAAAGTGLTPYVTTEFGLGLALVWFGVAAYLWRDSPTGGRQITATDTSDPNQSSPVAPLFRPRLLLPGPAWTVRQLS